VVPLREEPHDLDEVVASAGRHADDELTRSRPVVALADLPA
jgi:hypothetical protein